MYVRNEKAARGFSLKIKKKKLSIEMSDEQLPNSNPPSDVAIIRKGKT